MSEENPQTELFSKMVVETAPPYSHDLWEWNGVIRSTAPDLLSALRKCGEAMSILNAMGIDFTVKGKPVRIKSHCHPEDIVNVIWMNPRHQFGLKQGLELRNIVFLPEQFQSVRSAFINMDHTVSVLERRDGRIQVRTASKIETKTGK